MRNKNLVTAKGGEVTAPLTRARSAAFRACGQRPPLKVPIQQNHKRTLQGIPNSTDLDENNNNAPNNACCCKRKRAVLQDVANFCCKCSQRNCLNAGKIQAKINKPTRKGQVKVCKVAPSVALEAPLFQAASETKILQEMVKIESKSKEVISSNDLEEKVSLQLSNIRECAIDDHRLENQSFGMPSQPQFPPKKVKGGFSGDMTISSDLDIIDIDADLKEPRLCSIYAPDIYSNLRVAELARRPCPHFMETIQQDITQSMRGMLVDWLVEVSEGCKLASNTLYLTIYLIDWYLTGNCIERQRLQLLGITCMLLASKYEEGHAPHVEEFCLITGDTYTREEVLELEIQISKYLGFQLFSPTAKTFLRRFLRAAQASYKTPSLELEYLANYLAESTLIDYGFLNFLPSAIAASAVFLARWTLDQSNDPWNPTLEHYTSYKASDLKIIVLAIRDLQLNTNGCSLSVIRMKYMQQKFKSVPCKRYTLSKTLVMATVTTSHFVSRTSHVNCHGTSGSETKTNMAQMGLRNQAMTHNGLRSLNKLDMLQMRTQAKAIARQARHKVKNTENDRPAGKVICEQGMNLVFVGAEVGPWSKTGGLGDVLGGLPPAMAAKGHRVMTVSPRYDQYKDAWDTDVQVEIKVGDRIETVRFFHSYKRGVDRVFVDHPLFLQKVNGKTGSKIYGPRAGLDYQDNQLRFSLLCQAALEAPRVLNLNSSQYFSGPYGEDIVFIANDWHTALIPCYLKTMYKPRGMYKTAKVSFCIHNMAYQGRFPSSDFSLLNLPNQFKSSFDFIDGYEKPVKGRKINWMKAGILESDRVLTVSPYYAEELVSGVEKGVELDNIIRKTGITGIVNGMDVQEWNPATDKHIDAKYDATTVMDAKPLLKEALQAEVGLPVDRNIPLIGFIGRLEEQKGSDILAAAIPEFIGEDVQIVVLGTGKKDMEKQIEQLETLYPDKARGVAKFNVPLAHGIIAGADFMLIPSRFEPCGLIQLHAMRYGTVPIVASTGGLVDTVKEGFTGFQMGAFNVECEAVDPADVTAIATSVKRALASYGTPALKEMIQNGMAQDLSWKGPARLWEKMLLSLNVAGSEPGIEGDEIAPLAKENVATP